MVGVLYLIDAGNFVKWKDVEEPAPLVMCLVGINRLGWNVEDGVRITT